MAVHDVYKTETKKFLQLVRINESGLHHFIEVDSNANRIPINEVRNSLRHVTRRVEVSYMPDIVSTFKKMRPICKK